MNAFFFEILLLIINWRSFNSITAENYLKNNAMVSYNTAMYDKAENQLKLLLKINSTEPEVKLMMACIYYQLGKKKTAFSEIYKVNNDAKISYEAEKLLAKFYFNSKDTSNAILHFENALIITPNDALTRKSLIYLKSKYKNERKTSKNVTQNITNINVTGKNDKNSDYTQFLERLNQLNMTETQAKQIFDAIGNDEKKYLQNKNAIKNKNTGEFSNW